MPIKEVKFLKTIQEPEIAAHKMSKKIKNEILSRNGFINIAYDEEQLDGKIITLNKKEDKKKKLIVTYSSKCACKDAHERNNAINKLEKKLEKSKSLKSILSNSGYKKYMNLNGDSLITLDHDKINEAQKWDGLHDLITNISEKLVMRCFFATGSMGG